MPKNRGQLKKTSTKITRTQPKTRKQWAAKISAMCARVANQHAEGGIEIGCTLIAAKKALVLAHGHGEFEHMIERDLPFGASTAQRLMKVARDLRIRRLLKAAHGQVLPKSWRTLYELTKLTDHEFEDAVASGKVHPEMTRANANVLGVKVHHSTLRIEAPYYVADPQPSQPASTRYQTIVKNLPARHVVPVYKPALPAPSHDHANSDDDDSQLSETPLSIPHIEPLSTVERITRMLADASLDQHVEAIMAFDAHRPGYAAQLADQLNARRAA